MIAIAPSILSADFSRLGEQVQQAEQGGADRIHVDVMDGHFVPNLSMGPIVVKGLRPITHIPLEVHLMCTNPEKFVDAFIKEGADSILFHQEVASDPRPLMQQIKAKGKKVGLVVNPGTPVEVLEPYLAEIDLALVMTVWPGFGGQAFLPESPDRIRKLRNLIEKMNPNCELEVDGGIDKNTAPIVVKNGANVLVAGSAVFSVPSGPKAATAELAALASDGTFE